MLEFNPNTVSKMHIDINSCFATLEQQANPLLRGRPVAVAARKTPKGTIVAASYEAKRKGVKTGTRVFEALQMIPDIVILEPDPNKYRDAHSKIHRELTKYCDTVLAKSIDEFLLDFSTFHYTKEKLLDIGQQIKDVIRKNVGEYISVSVGLGTSSFTAKMASNIQKPDGLSFLDISNYKKVYLGFDIKDLYGINKGYEKRLSRHDIFTPTDLLNSDKNKLALAFQSVLGNFWFARMRGYEVDRDFFDRKSFGNSYVIGRATSDRDTLFALLSKLVFKTCERLRADFYQARGVHIGILYADNSYWHKSRLLKASLFATNDIYAEICKLFLESPYKGKTVKKLSEACFSLSPLSNVQLSLFDSYDKKNSLTTSVDSINSLYGDFTVIPGRMVGFEDYAPDAIGFGRL